MYSFISLVPVWAPVLWFLMIQHYLCELSFARMINFITFCIACEALITEHTNGSHWHLDDASLNNATLQSYDVHMPLRCDDGYWLKPSSTSGKPHTTQTVTCGINGTWTPPVADCSMISMHFCDNCYTSFPVIQEKTLRACPLDRQNASLCVFTYYIANRRENWLLIVLSCRYLMCKNSKFAGFFCLVKVSICRYMLATLYSHHILHIALCRIRG